MAKYRIVVNNESGSDQFRSEVLEEGEWKEVNGTQWWIWRPTEALARYDIEAHKIRTAKHERVIFVD